MSDPPHGPPRLVLRHRRADAAFAGRLAAGLLERGLRTGTSEEAQTGEERPAPSAVGLLVTPDALASGWARAEVERLRAPGKAAGGEVVPLLVAGAAAGAADLEGLGQAVDLGDPASWDRRLDRLIWPRLTRREVLFLSVHPLHRPQWSELHRAIQRLGLRFVDGENLNRARFHIGQIRRRGSHRIVPVVDVFEDWPFEPWQRRNSVEEYARFIFELQAETQGTQDELVFLLYHHSAALERAEPAPDPATRSRLEVLPVVHRDLADGDLDAALRQAWHTVQRELLKVEVSPASPGVPPGTGA